MITFSETEKILTKGIQKQISKPCGMIGNFETGPCLEIVNISNTDEFKKIFGYPNKNNYVEWHNVFNFLQYSDNLELVRVIDTETKNAGIKFDTGVENLNLDNLYNKTIADLTLKNYLDTGILFFNRNTKSEQELAFIVCKNEEEWNKSLTKEIVSKTDKKYEYITKDGVTVRKIYINNIQNEKTGYIKKFNELFTVKPKFDKNEFFVIVLKKNYSGLYNIAENFIVSTSKTSLNYVNTKINSISQLVYVKFFNIYTFDLTEKSITELAFKNSVFNKVNIVTDSIDYAKARAVLATGQSNVFTAYECIKQNAEICLDEICTILINKPNAVILANPFSEKKYQPFIKTEDEITNSLIADLGLNNQNNYFQAFSKNVLIYTGIKTQFSPYLNKLIYLPFIGDIAGLFSISKKFNIVAGPENSIIKNCKDLIFNFKAENIEKLKINGLNSVVKVHYNNNYFLSNMITASNESNVYKNGKNLILKNEIQIELENRLSIYKNKINDSILRFQVNTEVSKYLNTIKNQKIIEDFSVICDLTNNIDNSNKLSVLVLISVTSVIEQIKINIEI